MIIYRRFIVLLMVAFCPLLKAQNSRKKVNQANSDDMWVTSQVPSLATNVTHHTFRSASMQREVGFRLYLLPSYAKDTERRYPVIYHLHGGAETRRGACIRPAATGAWNRRSWIQ